MSDYSTQGVMNFLDFASQRGLMKKSSVTPIKTACNNIFPVLDESEASDVSKLDLEAVIQRYKNINSLKVRPDTMQTYATRVKYAVSEFIKYNDDPASWKPQGGQRSATSAQSSRREKPAPNGASQPIGNEPTPKGSSLDASQITHQFPIRRDMVVTVQGIPFDVRRSEMARLTAFLSNLVAEEVADEQMPLMLNAPPEES